MNRTRTIVTALLGAAFVASTSVAAMAQDEAPATPEGTDWQLTQYTSEGALADVPEGVRATLLLQGGEATGNGGCNSFFGSYQLDGEAITFGDNFGSTQMLCEGDAQSVEDAYLATLPTVTSWSITDDALSLSAGGEEPVLVYGGPASETSMSDIERVLAAIEALQARVGFMDQRIDDLEGGSAAKPAKQAKQTRPKKPQKPKARSKVQTTFPDWMRDEFRPEAQRSDDKNREQVRWSNRAKDADGLRVYARRGFCALKAGADPSQALDPDKDFRKARGALVQIAELSADAKNYRPDHAAIEAALPAAPESPYSQDQFYDLLVSAYNDIGESKPTLVGSFYLTPEFNCP